MDLLKLIDRSEKLFANDLIDNKNDLDFIVSNSSFSSWWSGLYWPGCNQRDI